MALFNSILKDADILLMLRTYLNRIRTIVIENVVAPALIKAHTCPVYSVKGLLLYYYLFGNKLKYQHT